MSLLLLHGKKPPAGGLGPVGPTTTAAIGTAVTSTLPGGLQTGHLMLWFIAHSSSSATVTTPSGWTLLQTVTAWSDGTAIGFARVWQSGDAAPVSTLSVSASWATDLYAVPSPSVNISAKANVAAQNTITNAVTPTANNCHIVSFAAADASGAARTWGCDRGTEILDQMDSQIHRQMVIETLSGGSGVSQSYVHTISGIAEEMGGIIVAVTP